MKLALLMAAAILGLASSAYGQTATGTSTSGSSSTSGAGAVSTSNGNQQGQTQTSTSGSSSTAGSVSGSASQGNTTTTGQNVSAGLSNQNVFQGTSIPRDTISTVYAPPQIVAPALSTTLTETCMGSASAGISVPWGGVSGGKTYTDAQCVRRLNARELSAQGWHAEACEVMMGDPEVAKAFTRTGRSCEWTPPPAYMAPPPVVQMQPLPPPTPQPPPISVNPPPERG